MGLMHPTICPPLFAFPFSFQPGKYMEKQQASCKRRNYHTYCCCTGIIPRKFQAVSSPALYSALWPPFSLNTSGSLFSDRPLAGWGACHAVRSLHDAYDATVVPRVCTSIAYRNRNLSWVIDDFDSARRATAEAAADNFTSLCSLLC